MEKLFGLIGVFGTWNAWLEKSKVSKSTCIATHKGLCDKLAMIQDDLKLIKEHLMGEK